MQRGTRVTILMRMCIPSQRPFLILASPNLSSWWLEMKTYMLVARTLVRAINTIVLRETVFDLLYIRKPFRCLYRIEFALLARISGSSWVPIAFPLKGLLRPYHTATVVLQRMDDENIEGNNKKQKKKKRFEPFGSTLRRFQFYTCCACLPVQFARSILKYIVLDRYDFGTQAIASYT